jgi:hypothetical protein
MSGIQLLQIVKDRYPETARVVLTAQNAPEVIALSRDIAHHTLEKSAPMEVVFDTLVSALEVKGDCDRAAMVQFIDQIDSVPASARVYQELTDLLRRPDAKIADAAVIVERDVAMTAKVMQLVNSAAFGLAKRVESSAEAVMYMGLENLRSLAIAMKVFTDAESKSMPYGFLSSLWDHSFMTGVYARNIAKHMKADKTVYEMCFAAGMLHDLGKIVLVSYNREWYKKVILRVGDTGDACSRAESVNVVESEKRPFLILMRRAIPVRRMHTFPIVVNLDVLKNRPLGIFSCPISHLVHQLDLQRPKKTLGDRVVPAIAFPTHAADKTVIRKKAAIHVRRILAPAIRMTDQSFIRSSLQHSLSKRSARQFGIEISTHRLTDDLSREQV